MSLHFQTKDEFVLALTESSLGGFKRLIQGVAQSEAGETRAGFVLALPRQAHEFGVRGDGINLFQLGVQTWGYSIHDYGLAEALRTDYKNFLDLFGDPGRNRWGLTPAAARAHGALISSILLGYITQTASTAAVGWAKPT